MMPRVKVLLPQWGMGMSEGTITGWLKAVGDQVSEEEPLATAEAEKVEDEILAPAGGRLAEILVEPGETIPVRTPVAIIEI
ncbi:MAG: lipoyl domain-containing protein [Rhodobacter sp.]|nr:lipoyl domain-containing protein [Rhodobacter sp.]MCY4167859.1 lipoyl domain-containing protein [Rhodobacter sp.]